ncbi:MAG: alpha/beta hydrolase [Desulfococcus sp.]|nr:MAG: alpha/beta hydrolase [Desulfococcus sp.]
METPVRIPVRPPAEYSGPSAGAPARPAAGPAFELEGRLSQGSAPGGAVICHPHPVYGGTMDTPVVQVMAEVCRKVGAATLRFNFRGVGKSGGRYGNGTGEAEDVIAAVSFLRNSGHPRIAVLGYSFGAWAAALAGGRLADADLLILVSPPIHLLDFRGIKNLPALGAVIAGDDDEWASEAGLRAMIPDWNPQAELILLPYTDHFYSGSLDVLSGALSPLISSLFPSA